MVRRYGHAMVSKQSAAFGVIFALSAVALVQTWLLDDRLKWPVWVWLPFFALLAWAMWQLRDPPNPSAKAFDFNPKRGLLYFLAGFLVFPLLALAEALFGADLSVSSMVLFTTFGSILAGILGSFTEHVGI